MGKGKIIFVLIIFLAALFGAVSPVFALNIEGPILIKFQQGYEINIQYDENGKYLIESFYPLGTTSYGECLEKKGWQTGNYNCTTWNDLHSDQGCQESNPTFNGCGFKVTDNGTSITVIAFAKQTDILWAEQKLTLSRPPPTTLILTVILSGSGTGIVSSNPTGINNCSFVKCEASFLKDSTVTLAATPSDGSTFTGWSGVCSGTGICQLIINSDKLAGAIFDIVPPQPGAVGDPCAQAGECQSGVCDQTAKTCQTLGANSPCISGSQCSSGSCSAEGTCQTGSAGTSCAQAGDCQSGLCSNGACQAPPPPPPPSGGGGGSPPTALTFDFSLSVSPSSGSVTQGGSVSASVITTLTSGTTNSVSFSASGLPLGVKAVFSPNSCSPTCSSILRFSADSAVRAGNYTITISGSGGGLTKTTTYTLLVSTAKPIILLSPTSFSSSASEKTSPISKTLVIINSGATGSTLNWSASSDVEWLSLTPSKGSLSSGKSASIAVSYNTANLKAGTYSAAITVSDPNAANNPQIVFVTLKIISEFNFSLSVSPEAGMVSQGSKISTKVTTTLTSGSASPVTFSASGLPSGVTANFSPNSCDPNCSSTLTFSASPTAAVVSSRFITVTASGGGIKKKTNYTLTIRAPGSEPIISLSQANFSRFAIQGLNPSDESLTITNSGSKGTVLKWKASSKASWLSFSPSSGSLNSGESANITISYSASELKAGTYSAVITVSDPDAANSPQTALINLTIEIPTLYINKSGKKSGAVISSPAGINCGTDCSFSFPGKISVTLTAAPEPGAAFIGWSGDCTGTDPCALLMDTHKFVTATFDIAAFRLNISKSVKGSGIIISSPFGINCEPDCSESYISGTKVTLEASSGDSSTFTGWSGDCSGTDICTVTMDSAKSVAANFEFLIYTLNVSKSGRGSGAVASLPEGIDCGTDCSEFYPYGSSIVLASTPTQKSIFAGWLGDCAGTGNCLLIMDNNKSTAANFNYKYTKAIIIGSSVFIFFVIAGVVIFILRRKVV